MNDVKVSLSNFGGVLIGNLLLECIDNSFSSEVIDNVLSIIFDSKLRRLDIIALTVKLDIKKELNEKFI